MAFEIEYADAPLGHKIHGVDLANLSEEEFRQVEDGEFFDLFDEGGELGRDLDGLLFVGHSISFR